MKTDVFNFNLPEQLIAQEPMADRAASRLLLIDRSARSWSDRQMRELPDLLRAGDLLILNDTRVVPARLRSTRDSSGGKVELLLLPTTPNEVNTSANGGVIRRVLTRSGGRLKVGETITLSGGAGCKVTMRERHGEAGDVVEFHCSPADFDTYIHEHGEVPLPPYIRRPTGPSAQTDRERYQTVFAQTPGAVAAPTAGLHFTPGLLEQIQSNGILIERLTLHVGPGTFRPVKADAVEQHFVDAEPYIIPERTVAAVNLAKKEKRRVIAVGTTSLRALEGSFAQGTLQGRSASGATDLFIYPPRTFNVVDGLLTNFHIPKSSLLMLVCALAAPGSSAGIELIQKAYEHAVTQEYRFYSYGDACLLL